MKKRGLTIKLLAFLLLLVIPSGVKAIHPVTRDTTLTSRDSLYFTFPDEEDGVYLSDVERKEYDKRVRRYRKHWERLIPTQSVIQNAGNMGFLSLGFGWDYGKRGQWETNMLFGFIPKYKSSRVKMTATLKENFIPWSIYIGRGVQVEPFRTGLYLNAVFGKEFWDEQPSRYPNDYYEFLSTKFRLNIFAGQGVTQIVPKNRLKFVKSVTFFYELSTCDLYIRSKYMDSNVGLWDIVGLSFGFKFQLL